MSRKDILPIPQNIGRVETSRQAKPRTLPLMPEPEDRLSLVEQPRAENKIVKQVGSTFELERERQARADEIEKRLSAGQAVIDLDPHVIDPSFLQDRMPGDIEGLLASIREQGQQVPILVRPHPEAAGRYQVAFGHRRLRAVAELGFRVKAIVRDLSDDQLVVAQGQENNERQDLTYIEKARFADRLKARFSRDVIMSALSVQKGDLSVMLSVVAKIPSELVDAIGPAPGVGRRSWMEFADYLTVGNNLDKAIDFSEGDDVRALPSDERFKAVMRRLKPSVERQAAEPWSSPGGHRLGQLKQGKTSLEISVNRKEAPEFAAFLLNNLPALFDEFRSKSANDQRHGE
ncbi:plasmid partitioning protein RepB [Rhizobium tumorigenes]|uniref:plasmid partitioning protein RepB n=1 Tax=Rhizobium tumorigenes TaxID=2041385 RepID=UPI00241DB8D7|nr:plasmid partitioning protein RepB [Rhizobium tumorigenes]WFS03326.1 plasmid partitioning protein RepB [Rhizobium tumorigenes]